MANFLRRIPPTILAFFTKTDRYFPEIEWASDNWTHNAICLFELVFGSREDIHGPQTTSWKAMRGGRVVAEGVIAHSFAGACVVFESYVRAYLKSWKFVPFRVYVPMMNTVGGFPVPASPWLFAIAVGSPTHTEDYSGSAGTTLDCVSTAAGSNRFAWAGFFYQNASTTTVSAMTYDGVAMVATADTPQSIPANGNNSKAVFLYGLASPSTTTNAVVSVTWAASLSASYIAVTTYTGAQSSSTADAHTSASGTAGGFTMTLTTVADNAWIFGFFRAEIGGTAAGTNTTMRYNNGDGGSGDTNAAQTPAGSHSVAFTFSSAVYGGIAASFGPFVAPAGPANLKSYNTNLKANIKSIDTNLIANVKSLDTNA